MKAYLLQQLSPKSEEPRPQQTEARTSFKKSKVSKNIVVKSQSSSESAEEKGQGSMGLLCNYFLSHIVPNGLGQFETKSIVEATGVKQRRLYDLLNILQGCGYAYKVSKATYNLRDPQEPPQNPHNSRNRSHKRRADSTLQALAGDVKQLLKEASNPINFKDICDRFQSQRSQSKMKPESIRRRVYQICKVLVLLGLVKKRKHSFQWVSDKLAVKTKQKRSQRSQSKTSKLKNRSQLQKTTIQKDQRSFEELAMLRNSVLQQLHTQEELNNFIRELRGGFWRKMEQQNSVKRQLRFE